ncbi:FRG domain-containing protein [bacterium]|nr:FRG domain-containing protein [bacterium]
MFELTEHVFTLAPAYIYRGQANFDWPLSSSLDRLRKSYPKRKNLSLGTPEYLDRPPSTEDEQLDAFRRAVRGRRGQNPSELSDDDFWALGQHHGLATPLLDWSRTPFAALYFAFKEERVEICGKFVEPEFRGVYALSSSTILHDSGASKEDQCAKIVSPDSHDNYRMLGQMGLFLRMPQDTDVETYVKRRFAGESLRPTLTMIRIPNKGRHECLVALNKMNVNEMTLFPDIDGAARHVNSLWQPGHEDSIAYV